MKTYEQMTFWERLSEAMADAGLKPTQGEVAKLAHIKQPSVHKWEHGGYPTLDRAIFIAKKLRVSVEWLLTGRGPKRPLRPDTARVVALYEQLDNELDRGEIVGRLETLIGLGRRKRSQDEGPDTVRPV